MSKIAIFEGLGRRRKSSYGTYRAKGGVWGKPAPKGSHWRLRKTRKDAGKGPRTEAQKKFVTAARACKVKWSCGGTGEGRRSQYNKCISAFLKTGKAPGGCSGQTFTRAKSKRGKKSKK